MKDHKENFQQKLPCRLINPCKSNLGAVSKTILDRINSEIRQLTMVNQWKNTGEVLQWFDSINDKHACLFIQLDIKEFYPSISKNLLTMAIEFAKSHTTISEEETRTIFHCGKSLLFHEDKAWINKSSDDCFDVTMGSYDGAEICELVGLLILHKLSSLVKKTDVGLYRDDGLIVVRNMRGRSTDKLRKNIINTFKEIGLQIEIETGMYSVNFLDVTLNLKTNNYQPFKKPNDEMAINCPLITTNIRIVHHCRTTSGNSKKSSTPFQPSNGLLSKASKAITQTLVLALFVSKKNLKFYITRTKKSF